MVALFDTVLDSSNYCSGQPGKRTGLHATFSESDLKNIPYQKDIDVPFFVTGAGPCFIFQDVQIELISTCEIPTGSSQKHQYKSSLSPSGQVEILFGEEEMPLRSNKSFSVNWISPSTLQQDAVELSQKPEEINRQARAQALETSKMPEVNQEQLNLQLISHLKEQLEESKRQWREETSHQIQTLVEMLVEREEQQTRKLMELLQEREEHQIRRLNDMMIEDREEHLDARAFFPNVSLVSFFVIVVALVLFIRDRYTRAKSDLL
jgi:flagellar biosynthesis GTPase FlhF